MKDVKINKLKVYNDPVHGFINIPNEFIFDVIEHPYFQRLRRICQTGLTQLVYPGARHSRFHHALGCLHLMQKAVEVLKMKHVEITQDEENAVYLAILLHDIGHGPFSHTLENSIIEGLHHEKLSLLLMEELNQVFKGKLSLAIQIFKGEYKKQFLTQLVSSQIDVDRLDYLKRDSFYTGVVEGNINPQRIISMMNVFENQLVIDAKGIYSIEKYLIARMFMYWQVYLHKTSFSAELYLIQVLKRAKELTKNGEHLFATTSFKYFLNRNENEDFSKEDLSFFTQLDDNDVMSSLKEWQNNSDVVLSYLSNALVNRCLPSSKIQNTPVSTTELQNLKEQAVKIIKHNKGDYFVHQTAIEVLAYNKHNNPIYIYYKDKSIKEITETEQQILATALNQPTKKYHICSLKNNK